MNFKVVVQSMDINCKAFIPHFFYMSGNMDIPGKQFGMSGNESKFTRKFNFLIFLHI
jgi:hypothetical protein